MLPDFRFFKNINLKKIVGQIRRFWIENQISDGYSDGNSNNDILTRLIKEIFKKNQQGSFSGSRSKVMSVKEVMILRQY